MDTEYNVVPVKEMVAKRFRGGDEVNGINIMVDWDDVYGEYVLRLPQIDLHKVGAHQISDQIIRVTSRADVAKQVFEYAVRAAEKASDVYDLFMKVEKYSQALSHDVEAEKDPVKEIVNALNHFLVTERSQGRNLRRTSYGSLEMSIQAGSSARSTPSLDSAIEYTEIELGFPNKVPPDYILQYAENRSNPTNTVYEWVPIKLVAKWFLEEGGSKLLLSTSDKV